MVLNVVLFLGSVRNGRNCIRVGTFLKNQIEAKGHNVILFDPLFMEFPLLRKPLHFYQPSETPPEWLIEHDKLIKLADAFVVVCGEYNRSIPPALTNMMNHFPPVSYRYKPCSIACYSAGSGGGIAAAMQLRSFLGELGMVTPGYVFSTRSVHMAFDEAGVPTESNSVNINTGVERFISEMVWYARALKGQREQGLPT